MGTAFRFENVSYKYAGTKRWALDGVSLSIEEGEFVGIVGPNAAGKSTLCRAANGLIPNSFTGELKGKVFVKNYNTAETKTVQLAQFVGLVFADPEAQLSQNTVWEEIAFGPANLGLPKHEIFQRVDEVLDLLKIMHLRDRSPYTLSGGEQQRVAIAAVLAMKPEILVLDEPTSNLDPQGTEEVFAAVKHLNESYHLTVLMVEHEIELLAEYASRLILMNEGKVVLDGSAREVFSQTNEFYKIGMNIPQVTEVAEILDRQYNLWRNKPYPLTVDEAYTLISDKSQW